MENITNKFPTMTSKDWIVVEQSEIILNKPLFLRIENRVTGDQFLHKKISVKQPRLRRAYTSRFIYNIPNTPQLMIPNSQTQILSSQTLDILIQDSSNDIRVYFKTLQIWQLLETIKILISTLSILIKKFGTFKLTKNMLKITKSNTPIIWINQFYQSNCIQYQSNQQNLITADFNKEIILNLFEILPEVSLQCTQMINYLNEILSEKKKLTFELAMVIIDNYAKKIELQMKVPRIVPLVRKDKKLISFKSLSETRIPAFLKTKSLNIQENHNEKNSTKICEQKIQAKTKQCSFPSLLKSQVDKNVPGIVQKESKILLTNNSIRLSSENDKNQKFEHSNLNIQKISSFLSKSNKNYQSCKSFMNFNSISAAETPSFDKKTHPVDWKVLSQMKFSLKNHQEIIKNNRIGQLKNRAKIVTQSHYQNPEIIVNQLQGDLQNIFSSELQKSFSILEEQFTILECQMDQILSL